MEASQLPKIELLYANNSIFHNTFSKLCLGESTIVIHICLYQVLTGIWSSKGQTNLSKVFFCLWYRRNARSGNLKKDDIVRRKYRNPNSAG